MSKATTAVKGLYQTYLGRDSGETGQQYWEDQWNNVYQNAKSQGMSDADAEQAATNNVGSDIAASKEAKVYSDYGIARTVYEGVEGFDAIDETPDWFETNFTADDPNEFLTGRDEDWASKLSTSNLENYLSTQNQQYGQYQGNTVGTEGNEWWGYQKTMAIDHYMSDAGGNYSFEDASKLADANVAMDIKRNTGHQNYLKFGSIGYGNPLQIATGVDGDGDLIFEEKYLNLDPSTNLTPTGTKIATQYQIDADGEFVIDDDGNKIATDNTATPYSWQYVADPNAPGGYRITPVVFNTGAGDSTVGHTFHMDNYVQDYGNKKTFLYPTTGLENVNASQFTLAANDPNKLNIAQWADTPAGKADIADDDFIHKNKHFQDVDGDGILDYQGGSKFDHTKYDSNLGLGPGQQVDIDWGGGWVTGLAGGPATAGYVPPVPEQQAMMGGGGGNTIIQLDQNQESTTAADKALKIEDRAIASGQGRQGFSTSKYKPTGNIRTLGIVS